MAGSDNNENNNDVIMDKQNQKKPIKNAFQILESFGAFHILCLCGICPVFLCIGMTAMSPVFLNMVPDHYCEQTIVDNTTARKSSNFSNDGNLVDYNFNNSEVQCNRFFENSFNGTNELKKNSSLLKLPCQQWVYNLTDGETIVSQFDLVCDSAWKRPLTISSFMLGIMFGSMFGGQLADEFGRKKCGLISFTIFMIIHFILAFSPNYWFYVVGLFFSGLSSIGYLFCFVWAQELMYTGKKRVFAAFCINAVTPAGSAIMSLVAYLAQDWRRIYIVCGIGYALSIPLLWFVPDSPTFLIGQSKTEEVIKILKKISRKNKLKIASEKMFTDISDINPKAKENNLPAHLLWQNKTLRKRLIIMCLLWIISMLNFFTLTYNSANLGGNTYVNNTVGCILDIASATILTAMMKKLKRKQALLLTSSALGISCILTPILKTVNPTAGIASALIGRFFGSATMFSVVFVTGEFFPTFLRNTSLCIASMSARFGSVLSPFIVFAGEQVDLSIPFYVIGGMGFVSIYLILLLPETCNQTLPTTLKEALELKDPKALCICKLTRNNGKLKRNVKNSCAIKDSFKCEA